MAVDAESGQLKWVFRTVPQDPTDDGWELAGDTWSGPLRQGGGVWTQPAADPETGLLYVNVSNPTPNYDGSSRTGMNLFTNSIVALRLDTRELAWYSQVIHHDIWDWDLMTGPTLGYVAYCVQKLLSRKSGHGTRLLVEVDLLTKE